MRKFFFKYFVAPYLRAYLDIPNESRIKYYVEQFLLEKELVRYNTNKVSSMSTKFLTLSVTHPLEMVVPEQQVLDIVEKSEFNDRFKKHVLDVVAESNEQTARRSSITAVRHAVKAAYNSGSNASISPTILTRAFPEAEPKF